MNRNILALFAVVSCGALAAAQTVSVSLSSPQNGQTVTAGATISWTISFSVSTGNNQGLALLVTDLVQDDANPAFLDIPLAGGVPVGMTNFSRPAGISNPGEAGPTGYVGVRRGTAGQRNLIQIGGAQNTFGVARPPGSGAAENATVTAGVGQSGSVTLATGSFPAPSVVGSYTFSLTNAIANVLEQVNAPPSISPVGQAAISLTAPSITFTVGSPSPCPGDVTGDRIVDLSDLAALLSQYGSTACPTCTGDIEGNDDDVDLNDLSLLLSNFGNTCP
jgi:hypothetical protein